MVEAQSMVEARQQALKQDVERFYLDVVDQQAPAAGASSGTSALAYLSESELEWDPEIWLFQVIAEYQGLPREEQRAFRLIPDESPAGPFNDVQLIHDVSLALVV
jgi:hypothetical protein